MCRCLNPNTHEYQVRVASDLISIYIFILKGKGTQKYKWILSKAFGKLHIFDANCMKIGFLVFKILQFYVSKMATNGGRHFEMALKQKIIKGIGLKTVKPYESIPKTKLFGANFLQIRQKRKKLRTIENLEMSSWEPANQ